MEKISESKATERKCCIRKTPIKEPQEAYPLNGDKLGRCLIINNIEFNHVEVGKRSGSEEDERRHREIFEGLGFKVSAKRNQTGQEMESIIEKKATSMKNENCSAFVLIVLTHGMEGYLCGIDYNPYTEDMRACLTYRNIVKILSNVNCPVLKNKPKLCFFQACNGRNFPQLAVDYADAIPMAEVERLPEASDILMSFAAQEGYCTIRDIDSGGIYAYNLAHVLVDYAWSYDILEMLNIVESKTRSDVIKYKDKKTKVCHNLCLSTSVKLIGWTKKFYFNPLLIMRKRMFCAVDPLETNPREQGPRLSCPRTE